MEKSSYDEIVQEDGGCQKNGEETVCVCNTDLCNDGKEESGIEKKCSSIFFVYPMLQYIYCSLYDTNRMQFDLLLE